MFCGAEIRIAPVDFCWHQITSAISIRLSFPRWCVARSIGWPWQNSFRFRCSVFLRAVDAFPAERNRADRKTIRTAIERLKHGRIVGLFPEGGIRDGARSLLEERALRPGASTLAHIASVPILPCVIVGSDRLYSKKRWLPLRRTPIWIAFGNPIPHFPDLEKSAARACIEHELAAAFKRLYAELREKFSLTEDDLPHSPQERMKCSRPLCRGVLLLLLKTRRQSAVTTISCDVLPRAVSICSCARRSICFSLVTICTRAVVRKWSDYVTACEKLTAEDYYAVPNGAEIAAVISDRPGTTITWQSPIDTKLSSEQHRACRFFPCRAGLEGADGSHVARAHVREPHRVSPLRGAL